MASVFLVCLISISIILISASSTTTTTTAATTAAATSAVTLSLTPIQTPPSSSSKPWEFIFHITKMTVERAHHLKNPSKKHPSPVFHSAIKTPLYPRSYGGYSVSLSFGTPPQKIPLVFDTGSSLLWVPCTSRYTCSNCTFSNVNTTKITTFKPKLSSTTRTLSCRSPKCALLFGPDVAANCSSTTGGGADDCPAYVLRYGLGATAGVLITDNIDLPGRTNVAVPGFLFGCSLISTRQPEGIAGFGRAPTSLPNQLKLGKFSYCLLSHKFDDVQKSSDLVLSRAGACQVAGVKYTPFLKNPSRSPYNEYYYVNLRKITVGKKRVRLPFRALVPDSEGNGGTIVDSGSTLTFMDRALFDPFVKEIMSQTPHYKRARNVEEQSGFRMCYDVSGERKRNVSVSFPEMVFHFKGRAKMELPLSNYFSLVDVDVLCLTIVTDNSPAGPTMPMGPAVILGNYQQQNFYIEYDLEHQRLGFVKHKCG